MKKLLVLILTAAVLALAFTASAQTNTGVTLSPEQVTQLNSGIDNLIPLIPAQYKGTVAAIIGWLATMAVIGRALIGFFNGGVLGVFASLFFGHKVTAPPSSGQTKTLLLLALALPALAFLTGCTTAIKRGNIVSITERGFGIHITATSSTTQTPEIMAGIFSQTVQLIPTSTNEIHSPNFANSASVGNSLNPFSLQGDENTASGADQTSLGTNIVQQPIIASHAANTLSN